MVFQGNYRPSSRWSLGGHWTVQMRNNGNFEGEAATVPVRRRSSATIPRRSRRA